MSNKKPPFDLINILPVFVLGRDDTVDNVEKIVKGTNGMIMGPILGHPRRGLLQVGTVHVDDVAKLHVLALNPALQGNQNFIAASPAGNWDAFFDIITRHYPKQLADGVIKFESIPVASSVPSNVDNSKAEKTFGFTFKTFEEQVISVVDHFLELSGVVSETKI